MDGHAKVRGFYGGPVGKKLDVLVTPEVLARMGQCLVDAFVKEAKKDFAKRGWSGQARDGSKPIWDSFSYQVVGERTIEVVSSFPDIDALTTRDIPRRRMTWLTQEAKDRRPSRYDLTPGERRRGMKKGGRVSKGERLPLVVPVKSSSGQVVYRTAPLTTQDAWIHPGIARFTFVDRAARSGRLACIEVVKEEVKKALLSSLSS